MKDFLWICWPKILYIIKSTFETSGTEKGIIVSGLNGLGKFCPNVTVLGSSKLSSIDKSTIQSSPSFKNTSQNKSNSLSSPSSQLLLLIYDK